ncbi:MAG: hypothetical protein QOG54_2056 [Actinomycetota bacterium]|nr:hypothetical protein [Actinomycetota bacterium]
MLEEMIVIVDDKPGALAELGELLGGAGVNIETLSASTHNGTGFVHLVVDDGEDAAELLQSTGFKVEQVRPVMTATLDDRPGELGRFCRELTVRGVDISAAYVVKRGGGETEVLFAVDDLEAAKS